MKYRFIEKNRSAFPVKKMCQTLNVTQSGFYRWEKTPISKRERENIRIKERVKEIFNVHKGMVGAPLVTADLRDESEFELEVAESQMIALVTGLCSALCS